MKTILLFLLSALATQAASLTLKWNYTNAATFLVYEHVGTNKVWLGATAATSFTHSNVAPGLKTYSVIASNGLASDPTLTSTNLPAPIQSITIEVTQVLESAPSPAGPWESETNATQLAVAAEPNRFYRARVLTRRIE